ncbi:HNH endonuclease family protein [Streptomyces sp. NPDC051162]|uniref:HNH endonuclease family protein n=2 Tax=unclassified Streptomyces TaxID=2593676 RepID=UPI0034240BFF
MVSYSTGVNRARRLRGAEQFLDRWCGGRGPAVFEVVPRAEAVHVVHAAEQADASAPGAGNSCDTRNDILARDLTDKKFKDGSKCVIDAGTLADPYTGGKIHFERGRKTSSAVQIDHIVALSNAWQTGAQKLPQARREALANDPLNLVSADGPANMGKGDKDASAWLPANKKFQCAYVARQVAVKKAYGLWVTSEEGDAMRKVLNGCPGEALPGEGAKGVALR